jgi:glycosyltransferase involved in cell wall biosynthesis
MSLFQHPDKVRLLELRNTYKWGGGPDKTILLSAEQHDRARLEVVIAYIRDVRDQQFSIAEKARAKGLTFYEIEEHGKLDLRVVRALEEIVVRHDINVIHSHDYKSDLFVYLLCRRLWKRKPVVISTQHGWALFGVRGYIYWLLDLFLMSRCDHVIAVSHATKEEMVNGGLPGDRISVIHNAIDTEVWSRQRATISRCDTLGFPNVFPVIGYVGRISPEKDLEAWLRSAALVSRTYPQARFVLVGDGRDGGLLGSLKHLATDLGIRENVHFLGYVDDLPGIYASFDLFLLSSRREGICNSLLEAMAMEVPVIATDVGGTKELVINEETGYLLKQGDVEGMAKAIITLLRDESLRRNIAVTARAHIENKFSFTSRLRRIETLYERLLDERLDHSLRGSIFIPTA